MAKETNRKSALCLVTAACFLCAASATSAQDAMFVDSAGNVGIGTNTPSQALHVLRGDGSAEVRVQDTGSTDGLTMFNLLNSGGHPKFRLEDGSQADVRWEFRTAGTQGFAERFQINKIGSGAINAEFQANGDLVIAGNLSQGSSRNIKTNIRTFDTRGTLEKLGKLEISEWSYKGDLQNRHVGPMAEDFFAVFGLGTDDKRISPSDMAGVSLAANRALLDRVYALEAENETLRTKLEKIEMRLDEGLRNNK